MPEAYLYLEDDEDVFRVHLKLDRYFIGRAPENDVRINDPRVGKRHCSINYADGVFSVSARKRAVRVNGRLIAGTQQLEHGSVLDLEGTLITFVQVPDCTPVTLQLGIATGNRPHWFTIVSRPHIFVGTDKGSVAIDDPGMSEQQFEVENFGPGLVFVRSLSKSVPTTLNGEPMESRRRLRDGDRIKAANTEMVACLLEREMPAIDEPLEWRAGRQISTPLLGPAPQVADRTEPEGALDPHGDVRPPGEEPTMDTEELSALALQVDALRSQFAELQITDTDVGEEESEDEQAAQATLLVDHAKLEKYRADLKAAAEAALASRAAPEPTRIPEPQPDAARRKLPRVNPNKAVKARRKQVADPRVKQLMERDTQTDLRVDDFLQAAKEELRRRRGQAPDGSTLDAKQRRKTMVDGQIPAAKPAAPAPQPPPKRPRRRSSDGVRHDAKTMAIPTAMSSSPPAKAAPSQATPYYMPTKEPAPEPEAPAPKAGAAYYLPGQGGGAARPGQSRATRDQKGGTMMDMPVVGGGPLGADDDADHYYIPADQRANEARRRSNADYYEESEDRREEARRRLRREQNRGKPRAQAQHVPNGDLGDAIKDIDFD